MFYNLRRHDHWSLINYMHDYIILEKKIQKIKKGKITATKKYQRLADLASNKILRVTIFKGYAGLFS